MYQTSTPSSNPAAQPAPQLPAHTQAPPEQTTALHLGLPGLYRLVEVVREEQNRALVAKLATPRPDYHALCNDLIPDSSSGDASQINFTKLQSVGLQPVGVMGPREAVSRFLVDQCQLPEAKGAQMLREKDGLEEGLYLWAPPSQAPAHAKRCFLVIWPASDSFLGTEHRCASSSGGQNVPLAV